MRKACYLTIIALVPFFAAAQGRQALKEADRFFGIRAYAEALPLFLQALEAGENDPMVHYKIGTCYLKSPNTNDQVKAISYLKHALDKGANVPAITWFELGETQLRDEDVDGAIMSFTRYQELTKSDKAAQKRAEDALFTCYTALAMMTMPRDLKVTNMGPVVNTEYTEYNPVVSADESVLAFTALRPNTGKTRSGDKFIEEIYISYNNSGSWSQPKVVPVASEYNVGTAGISADGQRMLIFMGGASDPGTLMQITRSGEEWSKPGVVAPTLNHPRYMETTASITPDGKVIYFASDRVGGLGGLDIWKIEKKADGTWSGAVNLGAPINTAANEDAPFIHPDQKTLFFTSDGHESMGGRDIFMSKLVAGKWRSPENMGYPVNTTANDNYFTLIADGTRAYFSSDRKGGSGAQDIYYLDMPEGVANIPLTMIKGKILNAENGEPIPTKIYLIDNETNKRLDFVYDPDPKTGKYLIILPPARNYDMVIESGDFLPYTVNINVPNQDYFYELYQMIYLKTIKQFDVVVGQEVQVKNAFYDTHEDQKADLRKTHEAKLVQEGAVDVYDMMLDLMAAQDEEGIQYLLGLIEHSDPIESIEFDESKNSRLEVAKRTYFYDETDESKFEKKDVGGNVILSLPTMVVSAEASRQKEEKKASLADPALLKKNARIYFDAGRSELKEQYHVQLDEILGILKQHPELGVEISGFASAEGSEELNRELSNKRAIAVLDYLNHRDIVRRRIIAKGYGATKDESSNKEESRRVEVRVVDLNML